MRRTKLPLRRLRKKSDSGATLSRAAPETRSSQCRQGGLRYPPSASLHLRVSCYQIGNELFSEDGDAFWEKNNGLPEEDQS
jgi:hypothetical protein